MFDISTETRTYVTSSKRDFLKALLEYFSLKKKFK